ncbi:MAG TPA: choice-of-anchor D domain-containing protein, partial [Symbiobacteriaceae bacterium]|nr:choice-of-anchor D domain-containing protein [Symbiobacteriaceae bacterium]
VEPATVDFGRWQIKTTAEPARAVTLTNPGPTRLEVTDALITGPAAREFKVTETTCRNRSLSAGESCTVTLAFLPAFQSDKAATLTFSGSQPLPHVTLAGTGILTGFRVLPAEAVFGESDVVELAITSLGPDAMMLRDVRIEGSDSFTVAAGQCIAVPLDPDQSCYITVKWDRKPRQRGTLILKGEGTERTVNLVAAGI